MRDASVVQANAKSEFVLLLKITQMNSKQKDQKMKRRSSKPQRWLVVKPEPLQPQPQGSVILLQSYLHLKKHKNMRSFIHAFLVVARCT